MSLATIETIQIHEGDRIRWTDNDKERGIYNASLATIAGIENGKVTVELANKDQVTLEKNDGEMPSIKDGQDADRRNVQADRKDDELGMPPLDMDDLSALPAMLKSGEQIRGLPEKNLSLDM